jgi:hypothetical protein
MAPSTTWRGEGEMEGPGAVLQDEQPFLLSLHLVHRARSLHTAQLENVTLLERFPRALPGSQPPRRAPSLLFLLQSRSLLERRAPALARAQSWASSPPSRGRGYPGPRRPRAVRAGGSGGPPRGPHPSRSRRCAARAYLCGPGRSRGRHPVV